MKLYDSNDGKILINTILNKNNLVLCDNITICTVIFILQVKY